MNDTLVTPRKGRWTPLAIAAMVFGFMLWWPLGLAILAYILWGGSVDDLAADILRQAREFFSSHAPRPASSGNSAFDAYREETLKRLEEERRRLDEERREFEEFVANLRRARDREEFEAFMKARKQGGGKPARKAKKA